MQEKLEKKYIVIKSFIHLRKCLMNLCNLCTYVKNLYELEAINQNKSSLCKRTKFHHCLNPVMSDHVYELRNRN